MILRTGWVTDNKVNRSIITSSSRMSTALSIPDYIVIGNPFSDTVNNLGVTIDCHQYTKASVLNLVNTAKFELRHISSIGHACFFSHTHACTHVRTHARTHALTHARTHTHACTHARTHAHTHSHTHSRTHARTHARTRTLTHSHTHSSTHEQTHARTLARMHGRTLSCTHAHTHARTHERTHV